MIRTRQRRKGWASARDNRSFSDIRRHVSMRRNSRCQAGPLGIATKQRVRRTRRVGLRTESGVEVGCDGRNRARWRKTGNETVRTWQSGGEETSGGRLTPWGYRWREISLGDVEEVVLEGFLAFRIHFLAENW